MEQGATLVLEADRLVRYEKTGVTRFNTISGKEKASVPYLEEPDIASHPQ